MKFICVFLIFAIKLVTEASQDSAEWQNFKRKFKKSYNLEDEELKRFEIFKENLKFIRKHNENKTLNYRLGVVQNADMTKDEMSEDNWTVGFWKTLWYNLKFRTIYPQYGSSENITDIPNSFDWRDHGAVNEIKNQNKGNRCGSCYAFATLSAVESHHFIKTGKLLNLSEQEILDCSFNFGCAGGSDMFTFDYLINNGISLAAGYPYESEEGSCRKSKAVQSKVKVYGYKLVYEPDLKGVLANFGPVVTGIYASPETFRFYKEGIYSDSLFNNTLMNHVVTLVGYGTDGNTGLDYWILRNSWGPYWGENGYMKLAMLNKTISYFSFLPLMNSTAAERNEIIYFINLDKTWQGIVSLIMLFLVIIIFCCVCFCSWLFIKKVYCKRNFYDI